MVAVAISAIDPLFPILDEDWTRLDTGPPIVEVESYAVVGNFVLLSIVRDPFTERDAGTVAFDVSSEEWHYMDRERNLPFIGQAFPCGDHLFLARSRSSDWNELAGFNISVTKTNNSSLMLSIMEVPVSTDAMAANNFPAISQVNSCLSRVMGSSVQWNVVSRIGTTTKIKRRTTSTLISTAQLMSRMMMQNQRGLGKL